MALNVCGVASVSNAFAFLDLEIDVFGNWSIDTLGVEEPKVVIRGRTCHLMAENSPGFCLSVSSFSSMLKSLVACSDFAIPSATKG